VNGLEYSRDSLKDAIKAKQPIDLLVKNQDRYRTVKVDYTGGPRYPVLQRIEGKPDRLSEIFKPRT
jgi:hypothetical protein